MLRTVTKLRAAAILATSVLAAPVPAQNVEPSYVGSEACKECHSEEWERWAGSHHALAWTWPGPDTVVADFDGTEFAHDGTLSQFRVTTDSAMDRKNAIRIPIIPIQIMDFRKSARLSRDSMGAILASLCSSERLSSAWIAT